MSSRTTVVTGRAPFGWRRRWSGAWILTLLVATLAAHGGTWDTAAYATRDAGSAGASMAVIQSFGAKTATRSATLSTSPGAGTTSGDLLVALIRNRNTAVVAPVSSVTDSVGDHWTKAVSVALGGHADGEIWYASNSATLSTSQAITVTVGGTSASTTAITVTVLEIAGASASPLDVTAAASGTSQPASTGTTAPSSQPAELAVGDIGWNGKVTPSAQTAGYTAAAVQQSTINNSAVGEQAAWDLLSTSGPQSYSARLSSSSTGWTGAIATFEAVQGPTGSVSGTVVDSVSSSPISGATVAYSGGSTTTDSTGAYMLSNVTGGTYTVTASAPGYVSQSQPVSVTGGSATVQGFSLTPLFGSISGTVTDSSTQNPISGATVTYSSGSNPTATPHVMVIMEENKGYAATLGSCVSDPYLCGLASSYASATSWYGVGHPSVPNYLAFDSGSTQGEANDCTSCGPFTATDLGGQLTAAGIPWTAYMETMPSACYTGVGGLPTSLYTKRHNPFVYFTDVLDNGCAAHVVQYPGVSGLVAALDGAGAPDFVWISPNLYDDMHSASVTTGDNWLQANLGPVLASPWFTSSNATVIVTMDEHDDDDTGCCGDAAGGQIPMVVISNAARGKGSMALTGDHIGALRTIEETYGLAYLGGAATPADGDLLPLFGNPGTTTTDSNGGYALNDVNPGTYTLTASAAGYVSEAIQVTVTAGVVTMQDFALTPVGVAGLNRCTMQCSGRGR
jgi:Phosphoesterase family/Carboxypeptidase regulatory-like domain